MLTTILLATALTALLAYAGGALVAIATDATLEEA